MTAPAQIPARPDAARSTTTPFGATPGAEGTHFRVWAPHAHRVAVRLADGAEHALEPEGDGIFAAHAAGVAPGTDYLLALDGDRALPDPTSRWQPHGVHGASRVVDPGAFAWTHAAWRGLPAIADYVIYELHVGTFTPAGTFDAVIPQLPRLRALGVTAIEVMPVAAFPGTRNWGYDGVHLYAPQHSYGGPEGLRRLVDAAHGEGIAVVLDVVYNHLGPEGNYLDAFGPYFTERYQTPWGRAVNYDGPDGAHVRRHVIENARHWIAEYHVDALRLDAIHGIFDGSPRHVLAELTDVVRADGEAAGRRVHLIAESDLNDARVVRPTREGGLGFDAQWADDLHHAVHAALTGERRGYYEPFGGLAQASAALAGPFVRPARASMLPAAPDDAALATDVPRDRFVVCLQNHDQVGNRATGDRLATLAPFARQKLGAATVLLSGYVPLLFMGEEYGETRPFLYFVSHSDAALVEAVREGRRREFADFAWGGDVPDPQAVDSFTRSTLADEASRTPEQRAMQTLYRGLLALRVDEPALRPGAAQVQATHGDDWVRWTLTPHDGGRAVCVVANFGEAPHAVPLPAGAAWTGVLSTDAAAYGGSGPDLPTCDGRSVTVAPHAAAVLVRGPGGAG
jgi:maltooligosyltrehalose trehalohydrolase